MATQQEINDFVEQIMPYFDPSPVEDDSVQQSWPRLDRGLSDVQDMQRFQQMHGIFDDGGNPYDLKPHATDAETNQKNTMFLTVSTVTGTAGATLNGAFHRLREDLEVEFPAVSSATTYYVVIEYDPVRAADGGAPLEAKVVTSLNYSQGKNYIILWEVDRRPSQLLSDATIRRVRPRAVGVIYVWAEEHKPDPARQPWGTLCVVGATGGIYRSTTVNEAGGDSGERAWVSVTSPPWKNLPVASSRTASIPTQYRIVGDRVELRGRVKDSQDRTLQPSNTPHNLVNLPAEATPTRGQIFGAAGNGAGNPVFMKVAVQTDGSVVVFPSAGMTYVDLGSVGPIFLR